MQNLNSITAMEQLEYHEFNQTLILKENWVQDVLLLVNYVSADSQNR